MTIDLDAAGPEQIRDGFTTGAAAATDRADESATVAASITDIADRYAGLGMAASTVGSVRAAAARYATAAATLHGAGEDLRAALTDFDAHDGLVAAAAAEVGNLAGADILTGDGRRHRTTTAPIGDPAMSSPQATKRSGSYDPGQPRAADGTWTTVGDVLGYADEDTCFGTDQVTGAGPTSTVLALMDFEADSDTQFNGGRYVAVATPRPGRWDPVTCTETWQNDDFYTPAGGYLPPYLDADEALAAAAHLDELADLATSGYQPPKPTRYSRAAQRLQHLIDADRTDLDESVGLGDDENFPLTVRELLAMLRDKDQAGAQAGTRRKVTAAASGAAGGETGVLWMDLSHTDDGTPRITVVGVESETENPDDDYWKPYVTEHTPDSARELAGKLRTFARAARTRAAR